MINCDSCDRHVHDLLLKRLRYRIEGSGSAPFVHAYIFCMRCKSSRDTWKISSSDALLELLSHSSFLCAFFSNKVRPWRLCAGLKSRRRHPSYCVRCTFSQDPVYRLFWVATAVPASYWVLDSNATHYWSYQKLSLLLLLRRKYRSFSLNRNVERVNRPSGALRGGGAFLARTSTWEKSAPTGPPFPSASRRTDRHRAPTRHVGKPPYSRHSGRPTPSHPSR